MSLFVQTNVASLKAQENFATTQLALNKTMEQLSSGYKINSAADDAAGFTISENLTGQINGVDQANRNAQDGVSLVQTAAGSLNQVQQMLQRVRELPQDLTLCIEAEVGIVVDVATGDAFQRQRF